MAYKAQRIWPCDLANHTCHFPPHWLPTRDTTRDTGLHPLHGLTRPPSLCSHVTFSVAWPLFTLVLLGLPPAPALNSSSPFSGWPFGNYHLPTHSIKSLCASCTVSLHRPKLHKQRTSTSVYWSNSSQDRVQHIVGTQINIFPANVKSKATRLTMDKWSRCYNKKTHHGSGHSEDVPNAMQLEVRIHKHTNQVCLGISQFSF